MLHIFVTFAILFLELPIYFNVFEQNKLTNNFITTHSGNGKLLEQLQSKWL
jgi:hypothetical protein